MSSSSHPPKINPSDDTAEQHQAKLMENSQAKDHQTDNSPAPMLPNIIAAPSSEANYTPGTQPVNSEMSEDFSPADSNTPESAIGNELPRHGEKNSISVAGPQPLNTKKAMTGATVAIVGIFGLSALWFSANQDVYTLNSQGAIVASDDSSQAEENAQPATLSAEDNQPTDTSVEFSNLPSLEQGFYQMWLETSEKTQSLGAFQINNDNKPITHQDQKPFQPDVSSASDGDTILVTIQSGDTPATSPSKTTILSGKVTKGSAALAFTAIDLSQSKGVFTIAAPSDLSGESQNAGIWFATTNGQELTGPGLTIPNAPEGWRYEGQVVYKDVALTTGKFSQPNQSDSFYGFTPNPDELPSNFPGEDYLVGAPEAIDVDFPANLTNGQWNVIISIEPDQDGQDPTGDNTFTLQPFTATIISGAESYREYELNLDTSNFPTGKITLKQ